MQEFKLGVLVLSGLFALVTAHLDAAANPKVLQVKQIKDAIPTDLHDLAIPPAPTPLDWTLDEDQNAVRLDRGLEVTHMRFNYLDKVGSQDAQQVRWCYERPLFHKNHTFPGEYEVEKTHNDPVVYVAGHAPKIQVVLRSKQPDNQNPGQYIDDPHIYKAEVWAIVNPEDPKINCGFAALQKKIVYFSGGESRETADPSSSKYVTFDLKDTVPAGFNSFKFSYTFILKGVWDAAGTLIDSLDGTVNPPVPVETKFDKTAVLHLYSTIGEPSNPWNNSDDDIVDPWVNALAFTGYRCGTFGLTERNKVGDKIIKYFFHDPTRQYEHVLGTTTFGKATSSPSGVTMALNLTDYLLGASAGSPTHVNCHTQSSAAVCLLNLAAGGTCIAEVMFRFGYIHPVRFVGVFEANNPFFLKPANWPHPMSGIDHTKVWTHISGNWYCYLRSYFGNHSFVKIYRGQLILDSCIGEVTSTDGLTIQDYLDTYRDTSTEAERHLPAEGGGTVEVGIGPDIMHLSLLGRR